MDGKTYTYANGSTGNSWSWDSSLRILSKSLALWFSVIGIGFALFASSELEKSWSSSSKSESRSAVPSG